MQKQKGFTIIELIVVIAIIAVLAGIVLVNVQQYILRAKDATIKADIDTVIKSSVEYYEINSTYTGFCATVDSIRLKVGSIAGKIYQTAACSSQIGPTPPAGSEFCFCSPLASTNQYYCADSTGVKKQVTLSDGATPNCATSLCSSTGGDGHCR